MRGGGLVGEFSGAFVAVKGEAVVGGFGRARAAASADKDDIETAIAIVIEETDPRAHGFDHEFIGGGTVFGREADAGFCRGILEADGRRRRRAQREERDDKDWSRTKHFWFKGSEVEKPYHKMTVAERMDLRSWQEGGSVS